MPRAGANLTAEAVIAHCRTQIAGYKCPRSVEFRNTPLPLSGAGKVLKRDLREPFWKTEQLRTDGAELGDQELDAIGVAARA